MLKYLYVDQISNFCTFLLDFSSDFKHVVLSRFNELMVLPYMVETIGMYGFQKNLSCNKIPYVALDMFQIVHKGLV